MCVEISKGTYESLLWVVLGTGLGMSFINIFIILHNIWQIYKRKIAKLLIVVFYVAMLVALLCNCVLWIRVLYILHTEEKEKYAMPIIITIFTAMYWYFFAALGLTMFQLFINIKQILGEINEQQGKLRVRVFSIVEFLFILLCSIVVMLIRFNMR